MDSKAGTDNLENISKVLKKVRDYGFIVITFVLYRIARILVLSFQKFTWSVIGVEKTRRDTKSGLNFRQGAHVQDVKWRRKIHPLDFADPANFITFHSGFKHPNYVLKPHVSLYCITKSEAVFVEVPANKKVHQSKDGIDLYTSQFLQAKKLIVMPLGVFHKVAQDLGDPKMPVMMISNTGRCGATLLCRMFEEVPGTLLIDEPDSLSNLAFLKKTASLSEAEYDNILASAIRLLCKPDDRTTMFCIKTRPCCCVQLRKINKLLPRIQHIFLYRNSLRTVSSYIGTMTGDTTAQFARFVADNALLSTIFPFCRKILYHYFCYVLDQERPVTKPTELTTVGLFTSVWASCVAHAVEGSDKGIPIIAILYDELMKSPRQSCSVLFHLLNIRPEFAKAAAQAFTLDLNKNQCQTFVSSDSRKTIPSEMRAEADGILRKYGLPKLGERFEMNSLANFDPPDFAKSLSRENLLER